MEEVCYRHCYRNGGVPHRTHSIVAAYTVYPLEWFLTPSHIEARKRRESCIVVTGLAPVMPPFPFPSHSPIQIVLAIIPY